MKGYSFEELVKLAAAAVKRAGDTMTGNLTTPKVLVSGAQGTEVNALTRKDYVDSAIAAGDALQVSKTGDTMTGNLNAPRVLVSGAQGLEVNALTRKDYVDGQVATRAPTAHTHTAADVGAVSKAGDTVTGTLTVSVDGASKTRMYAESTSAVFSMHDSSGAMRSNFHYNGADGIISINTYDASGAWISQILGATLNPAGLTTIRNPASYNAQGSIPESLTRKDYVDGQVATRAPMAHTHTVAAITDLKPQAANAAANTIALRDSDSDVHARLFRSTFGDESRIDGAIAFRVNNSTDNYTRYCNNPGAVRYWMNGVKTEWHMGWRAFIEDPNNPMTEYHIPNKAAAITYLTGDGNYRIASSNGSGVAGTERLRIDSIGNLFATAAIYEAGQRVYSPNNPPPLVSHNHSAAQSNADIVAGGWDHVGAYVMAAVITTATPPATNGTIAGSNLRPSGAGEFNYSGTALPGTWRLMGSILNANTDDRLDDRTSLFIRIA